MKRALAERAKQSGLPNGGGGVATPAPIPPVVDSGNSYSRPPIDSSVGLSNGNGSSIEACQSTPSTGPSAPAPAPIPMPHTQDKSLSISPVKTVSSSDLHKNSSGNQTNQKSPRPSPRPKKRLRAEQQTSASKIQLLLEEEDEDNSNASAFFLRHQNRALASELRSLKLQKDRLEREREYRRKHCSQALYSLQVLETIWAQMEAALTKNTRQHPHTGNSVLSNATTTSTSTTTGIGGTSPDVPPLPEELLSCSINSEAPLSTGSGSAVELTTALLTSLNALGATNGDTSRPIYDDSSADDANAEVPGTSSNSMDVDREPQSPVMTTNDNSTKASNELPIRTVEDISKLSGNIFKRSTILQTWIWQLIEQSSSSTPDANGDASQNGNKNNSSHASQQQHIASVLAKNKKLKARLEEVSRSRDEMTESDKRVRRGLYRLAAGRVELKEVLKAIVVSDQDKDAAAAWMEAAPATATATAPSALATTAGVASEGLVKSGEDGENDDASSKIDSVQMAQLQKQYADLEEVAKSRDAQIKELISEKEGRIKEINRLLLKEDGNQSVIPTDTEVRQSELYTGLSQKLMEMERKLSELSGRDTRLTEEWSKALGEAEVSRSAVEELQTKHVKKWAELVDRDVSEGERLDQIREKALAEEVAVLKHKLTQALENVRQAEASRKTLVEAVSLNESLQAKLDETKGKYLALQQSRAATPATDAAAGANAKGKPGASAACDSQATDKAEKSEKSFEKLQREHRRSRKELAAAISSKEAAKAKLERSEKERESLSQSNSRLLRQATEKDEMNAKSLSTILHLKQLTDQVSTENANLEQQVKSAQQLALAARLASNARVRLTEEIDKERKEMEVAVMEIEKKYQQAMKGKEEMESVLVQEKAKISGYVMEANKAKERCDQLAGESSKLEEEKKRLTESFVVAKKDAAEASIRLAGDASHTGTSGSGAVSGFTADQLSTQVSVLKQRLACPVCNHRDKNCILLRCRHMFCKSCVDENVKNRSRKCPACGTRFDTKDIADVWL